MNRRFAILALTAPSCLLTACGGSGTPDPVDLPFVRLQAFWPAKELQQTYSLRSDAEWQDAWRVHEPQIAPPAERPSVDFGRQMILGVTRGTGPNGCHGLTIVRVIEEFAVIRVEYRRAVPPPATLCTQALVALTDFVVVARSGKPVTFQQLGG